MFRTSAQLGRIYRNLAAAPQYELDRQIYFKTLFQPFGHLIAAVPPPASRAPIQAAIPMLGEGRGDSFVRLANE